MMLVKKQVLKNKIMRLSDSGWAYFLCSVCYFQFVFVAILLVLITIYYQYTKAAKGANQPQNIYYKHIAVKIISEN